MKLTEFGLLALVALVKQAISLSFGHTVFPPLIFFEPQPISFVELLHPVILLSPLPRSQTVPGARARNPAAGGLASRGRANTNNANNFNNNLVNVQQSVPAGNQRRTRARNGVLASRRARAPASRNTNSIFSMNNFANNANNALNRNSYFANGQQGLARNSALPSSQGGVMANSQVELLNRNTYFANGQQGLARNSALPSSQGGVMANSQAELLNRNTYFANGQQGLARNSAFPSSQGGVMANSQAELLNRNAILPNSQPEFLGSSGSLVGSQPQPLLNSAVSLGDALSGQTATGALDRQLLVNRQGESLLNTGNSLAQNSQMLPNLQEQYLNRGSFPAEPLSSQGTLPAKQQIP